MSNWENRRNLKLLYKKQHCETYNFIIMLKSIDRAHPSWVDQNMIDTRNKLLNDKAGSFCDTKSVILRWNHSIPWSDKKHKYITRLAKLFDKLKQAKLAFEEAGGKYE